MRERDLVRFLRSKREFRVERVSRCIAHPCRIVDNVAINVAIQPPQQLRVTLLEGDPVSITLIGDVTETIDISHMQPVVTSNSFSQLSTVQSSSACEVSIYTAAEATLTIGTVWAAIYSANRIVGTDELGRLKLTSTDVAICVGDIKVMPGDTLVDVNTGTRYVVESVRTARDRRGKVHHWEMDITEVVDYED